MKMGRTILITLLHLSSVLSFAQESGNILGKINDGEMNNEPLHFANISLKNTSRSAHTNLHGNFEMKDIEPGRYTLMITYPGYNPKEVALTIKDNKTHRLEEQLFAKTIDLGAVLMESESSETTMRSENSTAMDK